MESARVHSPFNKMNDSQWNTVRHAGVIQSMRKGKSFWYQGDRAHFCFVIISGTVRTQMYRSDESALDLGLFSSGDWIGVAELLLSGPYMTDCIASESCEVLSFSKSGLNQLLCIPVIHRWFLDEMARRQYALFSRVELMRPIDRLIRYLSEKDNAKNTIINCTQEEIAESIGTTRETVNRNLQKLQDEGLVRVGRGCVEVVDYEKLIRYSLQ